MKTTSLLTTKRALTVLAVIILLAAVIPPTIVAAPPAQGGTVIYYVHFGDTLFSISRYYGTTVPAIMAANGLTSEYIYAGQRLIIPLGGSYITPGPSVTPGPSPTPGGGFTCQYTVQYRDTLYSIAYRYKTTAYALMQANYLYIPYIRVGQILNVPCVTPTPAPFPTYTVQPGDNLFRIAIRNSTTIYALAVVNGIYNPNLIYAGQTLVIAYPGSYVWPTGIPTVTPGTPTTPAPGVSTSTPTATATTPTGGGGGNVCSGACSVVMRNLAYEPQTLTVTRGTTVTWLNIDTVNHTVTSGTPGNPNGIFRSQQLGGNQTFSFKFDNAGTYPYFCEIHGAQMTGTIIVQ